MGDRRGKVFDIHGIDGGLGLYVVRPHEVVHLLNEQESCVGICQSS